MNARKLYAALLAGTFVLAGACSTDESDRLAPGEDQPAIEPPAQDLQIAWRSKGSGEPYHLIAADFDGDGGKEIAVGGRRPALVEGDGSSRIWLADWIYGPDDNVHAFGDGEMVMGMVAVPAAGGASDLLVANAHGQAYRLDGRTGEPIWHEHLDAKFELFQPVLFGDPEAPLLFPTTGYAAYDAATGVEAWRSPLRSFPTLVTPARIAGSTAKGLIATIIIDGKVHPRGAAPAEEEKPKYATIHGLTADGELTWSYQFPDGEQPTAVAAADLDGEGTDSAVVGFDRGVIRAVSPDGTLRWEKPVVLFAEDPLRTFFDAVFARDVDGDGVDEIFAFVRDGDLRFTNAGKGPSRVIAFDSNGEELWRESWDQHERHASIETIAGRPTLLLGSGTWNRLATERILGIDLSPDATDRRVIETTSPYHVFSLAVNDDDQLVLGTMDGLLRGIDPTDGATAWTFYVNSLILDAATVVGPGDSDRIAVGADFGNVSLVEPGGAVRWNRRMDVGKYGAVTGIETATLDAGTDPVIVATAMAWAEDGAGSVEAFDLDGNRRFALRTAGIPLALATADLNGDGLDELITVELTDTCKLVISSETQRLHETALAPCSGAELSVADVDGDGSLEVGVRGLPGENTPSFLALLSGDGGSRWMVGEIDEGSYWMALVPGGMVHAGGTTGNRGFVQLRDGATGEKVWRTQLAPQPDLASPASTEIPGYAVFGTIVSDRNEDGAPEVAVGTYANDLVLLDGATGTIEWSLNLESSEILANYRHEGAALAFVPGHGELPGHLLAALGNDPYMRSSAIAVALEGAVLDAEPIEAAARQVIVARDGGVPTAVIVGGFGLYATNTDAPAK